MLVALHRYAYRFHALGGVNELQFYSENKEHAELISKSLVGRVAEIEKKYSRYRSGSVVSRINGSAGKGPVTIDAETRFLLGFAQACFEMSGGCFDATSGVLRRVWDFKSARVPTQSEIEAVLPLVGWEKVTLGDDFVQLAVPGMEIDFGGIGKEYAVDVLAGLCEESELRHAMINLGGDIRVVGPHPDGRPWAVGIREARGEHAPARKIELSCGAVATSGDYERFFESGGKRYCHILNPKTGYPVSDLRSVTVLAGSCMEAGSFSTTAMLLGRDEAIDLLSQRGLRGILVDGDGGVHCVGESERAGALIA